MSSEDRAPRDLVRHAVLAEEHGFAKAWISDHFHPWVGAQGHSPSCGRYSAASATATWSRPDPELLGRFAEQAPGKPRLAAAKSAVDPSGILNPGVLLG